ncbi:hypothetical protein, partial [Acinetobacter baumannii]|uniref:hypothetical protein n=1 Tax=Acinetobacter baumannii TaxID=470 RepID=UPI001C085969
APATSFQAGAKRGGACQAGNSFELSGGGVASAVIAEEVIPHWHTSDAPARLGSVVTWTPRRRRLRWGMGTIMPSIPCQFIENASA